MELRPPCLMILLTGLISVTRAESPKPVVIIKPDAQVFRGETVNFRCDMQGDGDTEWTYDWYKKDSREDLQQTTQEFNITSVTHSDRGEYTCRGRSHDSQSSEISDPVTLNVSDKPKPTVSVNPLSSIYTGDNIILSCNLQSSGWRFYWYKENKPSNYIKTTNTHINTMNGRALNKGETTFYCKAFRGNYESEFSDAALITVSERPKPVVNIQPYKPVLLGDSVTLTCYIWTGGPWEYHWYRNNEELRSAAGKNTYTITDVKGSDKSAFRCKGTQSSDPKYTQISDQFILTISEKPKPELTSNPQGDLFTGNPVTLYCRLNVHYSGWRYYWIKDTQSLETETETHSYTISSVQISDGGQYRCRAGKDNPVYYTHYSDALWLNVTESPKPVVVIKPDTRVFRGEKVIFLCEMPTGRSAHWSYTWYSNKFYEPFSPASLFRIQLITDYNSGTYWCRGDISYDQKSKMSDPVGLWVSAKPKPDLTSDLKGPALSGNSVTLYCTLNAQSAGWRFYWRKDEQINETETETHSYTIRPVNVSDGGQYRCRAGRGNPVYYTHYSDTLWVNITGESPPVSLIINPSRSQHFTADSLSLSCEDQRNSTGWTVRGYTHNELFNCSSDSGFSCNISALSISHTGVYWCQSESGERSISVNITVHHGDVILDSPIHSVTDGKPLTLCCLYRNTKILVSGVYFYKNDFIFKNQARRQMTISSISNSEEGFYHCKHPERGESPNSWISVKVSNSISTGAIIGLSLAFMFVIIMILLILLLCYRKKKGVFAAGISYRTYSRTMIRN